MTPKEAVDKIKALFTSQEKPPAKQKFDETGKLSDGTEIQYTELVVGGQIAVPDADGNFVPAPAGDLELEDGRIVVITEPGIIAEIKDAVPPVDNTEMQQQITAMKAALAATEKKLAASDARIADLTKRLEEQGTRSEAVFQAYNDYITASAEEEAKGTAKPKQSVFAEQAKKKQDAKARWMDSLKTFRERTKAKA